MFTPQTVPLPDLWPACRTHHCGSAAAFARVDEPFGPVVVTCENGHFRMYRRKSDFRRGGRYAGVFGEGAVAADPAAAARERLLEPSERRRAEILEDAERCALCGTPPAEHPYRPDLDVRGDREVWTWLQRWRPVLFAELREAVAIAGQREPVTLATWRSRIPARLREAVVRELADSALETRQIVPVERLAGAAGAALSQRELGFAVNRLLVAMCRACGEKRRRPHATRDDYLHDYVVALHGGDERLARADATAWRMMETVATHAARAGFTAEERTA